MLPASSIAMVKLGTLSVGSDPARLEARRKIRFLAANVGTDSIEATRLATGVSEIC